MLLLLVVCKEAAFENFDPIVLCDKGGSQDECVTFLRCEPNSALFIFNQAEMILIVTKRDLG